MHYRAQKKLVYVVAVGVELLVLLPLTIIGVLYDLPALFSFSVWLSMPFGFTVVSLGLASNALTAEYGLWGDKELRPCPPSLSQAKFIYTSGRIGERFHARGLLQLSWSADGIAI